MSMSEWAKNEVALACKHENPNRKEGEWDYGCSCYESALKAYLSLMNDGHSGMSFSFTANILKRLLESKPLTPIEDMADIWKYSYMKEDGTKSYQCIRLGSLFKNVDTNGNISYTDIERFYCKDAQSGCTYHCGLERSILDELFPIKMPYYPLSGYYVIKTSEALTNRKNGDFDTKAIFSIKCPTGEIVQVNRYFASDEDEKGWHEIDANEYNKRIEIDKKRREQEESK